MKGPSLPSESERVERCTYVGIGCLDPEASPMTHTVQFEVSEETLAALRRSPGEYARDLRLAAAAKLFELGRVSQEVAADIAGLSRADFLRALGAFNVSPFQDTPESLEREVGGG
jgi:predicted HTH domain antitoxin